MGDAQPFISPLHQGTSGADINTSSTELTRCLFQGAIEGSAHQGLAPSIGKGNSPRPPHLLADPDTPPAEDAEIVVPVKEGVPPLYRKIPVDIGEGHLIYPDVIRYPLQLTVPVLGTEYTAFGHPHMAQADIKGLAALLPVAGKACIRVLAQNELQDTTPQFLKPRGIGIHYHAISSGEGAGSGETRYPLNLSNTEAARPVGG
jgi:hypothetical protein